VTIAVLASLTVSLVKVSDLREDIRAIRTEVRAVMRDLKLLHRQSLFSALEELVEEFIKTQLSLIDNGQAVMLEECRHPFRA
jgi:hypothetical protein